MKISRLFEKIFEKAELFCGFGVFISEETERRTKMKKISFLTLLALCLFMISCGEEYSCGGPPPEITVLPESEETSALVETTALITHILVDWMDFVRVNGKTYDGAWENKEVDESRIGEKLGEILYKVKSYYESEEELHQADKRDFTAAFRPIGCEIFSVKDDENSIAVLDDGKYYLYTANSD